MHTTYWLHDTKTDIPYTLEIKANNENVEITIHYKIATITYRLVNGQDEAIIELPFTKDVVKGDKINKILDDIEELLRRSELL